MTALRHRLVAATLSVVWLTCAVPASAAPAPLPDWGDGAKPDKPKSGPDKPKSGPAPLPDWGVEDKPAGKPDKPASKPSKPAKKPSKPSEPEPEPEPEPMPEPEAMPEPEPTPGPTAVEEPGPEPDAPAATEAPRAVEGPMPAPRTDEAAAKRLVGKQQLIIGAVWMTGGLAGVAVITLGALRKRSAERDLMAGVNPDTATRLGDQIKTSDTMMAAGAVAGAIGLGLGIALIGAGVRDLKAGRASQTQARARVLPALGGVVVSGHF